MTDRRVARLASAGRSISPDLYEAEAHPETVGVHEERDHAEMALLRAAHALDDHLNALRVRRPDAEAHAVLRDLRAKLKVPPCEVRHRASPQAP